MPLLTYFLSTDISRSFLRGPWSDLNPLHPTVAHILSHLLSVWNTAIRRYLQEFFLFLELMGTQVTGPRQCPAASTLLAVCVTTHESAYTEQLLQPVFCRSVQRQAIIPI
jgi:hypothetical protein